MRVLVVYNPVAGPRDVAHDLEQAIGLLRAQGWQVDVRRTLGPGDATTFARQAAADGYDMVAAAGGDGTLGEVATGLVGTACAMGVLPVGTGNVWAHMLDLPVWTPVYRAALSDAAKVLTQGEIRQIDLGQIGERYFMLWVGVGLDAQVVTSVEPTREIRRSLGSLGILAYVVSTVTQLLGLRGSRVTVSIDGHTMRQRVILVIITNAQLYGPSWRLAPQAQLDDGLLDVYVFKGSNILDVARYIIMLILGRHRRDPKIETFRARRVDIQSDRSLPFHVDGDVAGSTPLSVTVVPKALRVVFPPWASESLFEGQGRGQHDLTLGDRILMRLRYEQERLKEEGERLRDDVEHLFGARDDD